MARKLTFPLFVLLILLAFQLAQAQPGSPIVEGQTCGGDRTGTYPNCSQADNTLTPQSLDTATGGEPALGLCAGVDATNLNQWFFVPCGGGGAGNPGGPVGSVQIHGVGTVFTGFSHLTYDDAQQILSVGTGGVNIAPQATAGGKALLREASNNGTDTWGFDLTTDNLTSTVNCYVSGGRILGDCQQYAATGRTEGVTIENLTDTHDMIMFHVAHDLETVVAVGCQCQGTCTPTVAQFALQTSTGTTMTHLTPSCSINTGAITFETVTANNTLSPGVGVMFNTINAPTPGDTYAISIRIQRQ